MKYRREAAMLAAASVIAEELFDGHMTIMRFTTGWRFCFGPQPAGREDIEAMHSGRSLLEAIARAIAAIGIAEA